MKLMSVSFNKSYTADQLVASKYLPRCSGLAQRTYLAVQYNIDAKNLSGILKALETENRKMSKLRVEGNKK